MPKREVEFTPWGFLAVFCNLDEQGTCEIYHEIPGFHTFPDNNFALACEVHTMFNFNPGPSIWNFRSNSFCLTRAIVLEMRVFGVQWPCWLRPNTCAKRLEDEENIRSRWPNWRLIHREVGSCSQQAFASVHSLTNINALQFQQLHCIRRASFFWLLMRVLFSLIGLSSLDL